MTTDKIMEEIRKDGDELDFEPLKKLSSDRMDEIHALYPVVSYADVADIFTFLCKLEFGDMAYALSRATSNEVAREIMLDVLFTIVCSLEEELVPNLDVDLVRKLTEKDK